MTKGTVLVVDDIKDNIEILTEILHPHYKVKAATSGPMALKIARSPQPPDLILLDIMMPEMDGISVCKELKKDGLTGQIPVIFITAMGEIEDESAGFAAGAVDYITKPISPTLVLARVQTHLHLYQQSRFLESRVQERTAELEQTRLEVIRSLGRAAEYRDDDTGKHVIRMSHYSRLIAEASGLGRNASNLIYHAAPMHDIGKIGIPDNILQKRGPLNEMEWEIMKTHPRIGAEILGNQESELLRSAEVAAMTHHEKWDGTGYPNGLAGEAIPLIGRIIAIADVFDALTSERPYKEPWPLQKALDLILSEANRHFDPQLVEPFQKALPEIQKISRLYRD